MSDIARACRSVDGRAAEADENDSRLIADDHRMFREALRHLIDGKPGIHVIGEAGDGHEAVQLAVEMTAEVLLLDLSMPRRSGLEPREYRWVSPSGLSSH